MTEQSISSKQQQETAASKTIDLELSQTSEGGGKEHLLSLKMKSPMPIFLSQETAQPKTLLTEHDSMPMVNPDEQSQQHQQQQILQSQKSIPHERIQAHYVQKPSLLMYLAVLSALLGAIGFGLGIGWSAPTFAQFDMVDSDYRPKNKEILSWISSSLTLSALFGALFSGWIIQRYGTRFALISYGVPFTLGWALIVSSFNDIQLLVGRILLGFVIGAVSGTVPPYIIDISTISIRGTLGALFQLFIVTGILIAYVIGAMLPWRIASMISTIPTILLSLLMFMMPEGPKWLVQNKQNDRAKRSLQKFRGSKSEIDKEFDFLLKEHDLNVRFRENIQMMHPSQSKGKLGPMRMFLHRQNLQPLILSIGLMVFQQLSGINAVMFYSTLIIKESSSTISAFLGTIVIGVAQWIATIVGASLVDWTGRKILLIISGTLHVVSMLVFGIYYTSYSQDQSPIVPMETTSSSLLMNTLETFNLTTTILPIETSETSSFGWIPVSCMVIFIIGFSIGWGPVPWLMVSEIAPQESKSLITSISSCSNWMFAFLVTKTFPQLQDSLTKQGVFYLFSALSLLSILFTIFMLPETKNKSTEEIRKLFEPRSKAEPVKQTTMSVTQTLSSDTV